jgi:hypothetical protein
MKGMSFLSTRLEKGHHVNVAYDLGVIYYTLPFP